MKLMAFRLARPHKQWCTSCTHLPFSPHSFHILNHLPHPLMTSYHFWASLWANGGQSSQISKFYMDAQINTGLMCCGTLKLTHKTLCFMLVCRWRSMTMPPCCQRWGHCGRVGQFFIRIYRRTCRLAYRIRTFVPALLGHIQLGMYMDSFILFLLS